MPNVTDAAVSAILRKAIQDCVELESRSAVHGNGALTGAANPEYTTPFPMDPESLFASPAAESIKAEMVRAGEKLWQRAYVDGNGGNLSARISDNYVICTPTLCSKGDLQTSDLSLVDLNNCQVCGDRAQTSEILLHLEIYRKVPSAQAVIHCHPPYATAYALTGTAPRANLTPEQAVFIGPLVLAPYETPGTLEFARTVLPFVEEHNTILLSNHGVVCWADTITHTQWYVEVVENYCKTLAIASQLGVPIREIPSSKIDDLLAVKKRLGLPDPRFKEASGPGPGQPDTTDHASSLPRFSGNQVDALVSSITSQVMAFFKPA